MEFSEFYNYCKYIFKENSYLPEVDESKALQLFKLTKRMLEVNKSMNLTSITDEKTVILKHYADSLAISSYIQQDSTLADIGCGAGFPTLPLAIFRPDIKITAIDSTAKRIAYVNATAAELSLTNISAIAGRAEELANSTEYREKFDYVTARAVAALPILTELCLPFVRLGGQFIAMKSQKAEEEIVASSSAISKCGGRLESAAQIILKSEEAADIRNITIISKASKTPSGLPRHYSKISKKPL